MTAVGPTGGPELELEFPPKPAYVRMVRHAVGALVRLHDVTDDLVEDIKLAISEACTTALPAGGDAREMQEPLRLFASADGTRLTLELIDPGRELESAVAGHPSEIQTEDLPFEKTLSLPVIRGLVDEVALSPREEGGASMLMTVSLEVEAGK